ncbi:MAG TPA: metal-dependent hydrolase, partial [Anaerolineales bacterium]|nr:metal-dependent hydrolase [Anaerolineales bacterium]
LPTAGLHRTYTHSLFTALAVAAVFYLVAWVAKQPRWGDLGLGLGAGILMHILLDLVVWFNGVEILWPLPSWINLWSRVAPPAWFDQLLLSAEFLFFGLFFLWLESAARRQNTDQDYLPRLRVWIWLQGALFLIFTALAYGLPRVFLIPYGTFYLLSLGLSIAVTIRMRETLAAMAVRPRGGKIKASLSSR